MGRYTGPVCRFCRREGVKLCDKNKCATVKRNFPPGQHGQSRKGKPSDYSRQLREKQKARRMFGLSENQMLRYYKTAVTSIDESGPRMLEEMERRLDNVIFRSGFASSRRQARQFVSHGLFSLNGQRVTVPSIQVKTGDSFTVREKNRPMPAFENLSKAGANAPQWLTVEAAAYTGKVLSKPEKSDLESILDSQMIIEFYSR